MIQGAMNTMDTTTKGDCSLRPFPQEPPAAMTLEAYWTQYRNRMISHSGSCVFVSGNKLDASGNVVDAGGVFEEF